MQSPLALQPLLEMKSEILESDRITPVASLCNAAWGSYALLTQRGLIGVMRRRCRNRWWYPPSLLLLPLAESDDPGGLGFPVGDSPMLRGARFSKDLAQQTFDCPMNRAE